MGDCPGFSQDKVNFHWKPGRGTARRDDPTWQNRTGYSIPCAIMLSSSVGEWGGGNSLTAWERGAAAVQETVALFCGLCSDCLFCVFPLSVSLLLLFPLSAVLLNCPYPNPSVSASFFPFSSAPWPGEGRPCGNLLPAAAKSYH